MSDFVYVLNYVFHMMKDRGTTMDTRTELNRLLDTLTPNQILYVYTLMLKMFGIHIVKKG